MVPTGTVLWTPGIAETPQLRVLTFVVLLTVHSSGLCLGLFRVIRSGLRGTGGVSSNYGMQFGVKVAGLQLSIWSIVGLSGPVACASQFHSLSYPASPKQSFHR